jgi:serine/threonine protein kinase
MNHPIGQLLGKYRITRELGVGAFGTIYQAEDVHLGAEAVIKILDLHLAEVEFEPFLQEARQLTHLAHPNIARVLDAGVEDGMPFLVMQYAPKGTLAHWYPRQTKHAPQVILRHVLEAASALQYAHNQGYIHQDVKPDNVLLGQADEVLLSDFGVAMLVKDLRDTSTQPVVGRPASATPEGFFVGTPAYAAPEQFQENPCYASDQYALGVMIYQWLTGELPFAGGMLEVIGRKMREPPPSPRAKVPALSAEVSSVVMKSLATQPTDRFPTVQAFAEAFKQACVQQAPTPAIAPGGRLGNYKLVRFLGEGHFAQVWLGEHIRLGMPAAIKVLHKLSAAEQQERFMHESRTVARLEHPNIVRVLDFGVEGTMPYLVMSFASNGSLRERHPEGMPVPLDLVLSYVKQVAAALQYAHDRHMVHRDVKPANMLIGRNDEVLLSDFGIAVETPSHPPEFRSAAGTIAYIAPEQLLGKAARASDQYSLAGVVYEWLAGERPFRGSFAEIIGQQMYGPPPSLRNNVPSLPPLVDWVVLRALAKDPKQRFASITAFATAFEHASRS